MQILRHGANGWTLASLILVALAGSHLRAEDSPDLIPLIQKLNSESFDVRNAAALSLEKMGEDARLALEAALAAKPDTEAQRGIERLLEKLPPRKVLYAKVLLPGAAPDSSLKVESWIAKEINGNDGFPLHAISEWCLVTETASTRFMSEIRCNIPVEASIARKAGKITVHFTIHGPFPTSVHGNTVDDELGVRAVASIGDKEKPHAYVALTVGPEPRNPASYQKIAKADQEEPFKP